MTKKDFMKTVKETHKVEIFAMSNLHSEDTGVSGAVIFVSSGEFEGKKSQHGPRVKVMVGNKVSSEALRKAVTVSISDPPRIIGDGKLSPALRKKVFTFITENKDTLLGYWQFNLTTREMLDAIEPI